MYKVSAFLTYFLVSTVWATSSMASATEPVLSDVALMGGSKQGIDSLYLDDKMITKLSDELSWRRLLLYPDGKSASRVPDKNFFLHPDGKHNPKAELIANLSALTSPDAHEYLCRFPARSHWLMTQIPTLQAYLSAQGQTSCPQVDEWLSQVNARQLTLIHAEEHVNRLGSMMAHTLVKIDNDKSLQSQNSDDAYFFNFATDEQSQENVATSSINAFRGRGVGAMTFGQYTDKQAHYLIGDKRDIWQYRLDLPQATIDQIMRHLWEVKDTSRYYNFLNNNCASEILRLIDVADLDSRLLGQVGQITAPSEVSRLLDKKGLLLSSSFVPSLRTVEQANINVKDVFDTQNFENLIKNHQTAFNQLIASQNNPVFANATHRLMIGANVHDGSNQSDKIDGGVLVSLRGGYQDLLDRQMGKRDFLNVNLMGATVSLDDDRIRIKDATVLEILALNPKNSTSAGASYGGHLKAIQVIDASSKDNDEHLVGSIGAEYGTSLLIGKGKRGTGETAKSQCYALGTATVQAGNITKGVRTGIGAKLGCVHHYNDNVRFLINAQLPYWYHGAGNANDDERLGYFQPNIYLGGQYDLRQNHALRLGLHHTTHYDDTATSMNVSYVWHFD